MKQYSFRVRQERHGLYGIQKIHLLRIKFIRKPCTFNLLSSNYSISWLLCDRPDSIDRFDFKTLKMLLSILINYWTFCIRLKIFNFTWGTECWYDKCNPLFVYPQLQTLFRIFSANQADKYQSITDLWIKT